MLNLYSIFHLNLAYSSIPESQRLEVIQRCFWPLLRLATEDGIPIAIEAPGYTLEVVESLDPLWIKELKQAIARKKVEFVGSGYTQLIGPLVPAEVNEWNLKIGIKVYKKLLHIASNVWFINEQAYSRGIVEHYSNLGAKGIMMEWNNPRSLHPEWDSEYRYYPQIAVGNNGKTIPVLWNDSISFQKFQRYAHNDIGFDEMAQYLTDHVGSQNRYFCLYGNDAEIFDFRPGRFKTEPKLVKDGEWSRIRYLYRRFQGEHRFELVLPSDVFEAASDASGLPSLMPISLESAVQPIPVKKQPKYNATRWQVTGRNSAWLNAQCNEIYRRICVARDRKVVSGKDLRKLEKDLCYLWSSDFRTHIVHERWTVLSEQIEETLNNLERMIGSHDDGFHIKEIPVEVNGVFGTIFFSTKQEDNAVENPFLKNIDMGERFVQIKTASVDIVFNHRRGLSIESLAFPGIFPKPLLGTIKHGYFEDISLGADWYSANTVLQRPGKSQITDLERTDPVFSNGTSLRGSWIGCVGETSTEVGTIHKRFTVYQDIPQVDMEFTFQWEKIPLGSFRSGFVTLLPESFDSSSMFYATHNGGYEIEVFQMNNRSIAQGAPSSGVVTASTGLGATDGVVVIGDRMKGMAFYFDQAVCAAMPMISFRSADPSFFARIMFSLGEMDESRTEAMPGPVKFVYSITGMVRR
jgi:hypothetical protein